MRLGQYTEQLPADDENTYGQLQQASARIFQNSAII
jgi:hypothetical protein